MRPLLTKNLFLMLTIVTVLPTTAQAAESSGWYVALSAGVSLLNDTAGTIANAPTPGNTVRTQSPIDPGFEGQIAFGRAFGPIRLEGEFGYSRNSQDRYIAVVPPTGSIPATVSDISYRGMLNAYYDLLDGPLCPYFGGGFGVGHVDIDFVGPRAPFPTEAPRQLIKDGDTRFAYQLMAGASLALNANLSLTAQYRWLDIGTVNGRDVRGEGFTRDHAGHNVDFGIRYAF